MRIILILLLGIVGLVLLLFVYCSLVLASKADEKGKYK